MEVEKILDPAFDVNVYLVKSDVGLLLDAGTGLQSRTVIDQVKTRLRAVPLKRFVLTHRHVDHAGGAPALSKAFGVVPQISVDDAPALVGGDQRSTGANLFGVTMEPLEVEVVQYGQKIDLGGAVLKVIHTPGHTIGSICLLSDDGSLFTGDTVFAYGGIGRWDLDTGDLRQLLSSLKMLKALDVEDLYPGHGPAIQGDAESHLELAMEMAEAYGPRTRGRGA